MDLKRGKMESENKAYLVEDDGGAKYWVVATSIEEANNFVNKELSFDESEYRSKVIEVREIDPKTTPTWDEGGHEIGVMADFMTEKGILACSEWP